MNNLKAIMKKSKAKGFKSIKEECSNYSCSCELCSVHRVLEDCVSLTNLEQLLEPYEEPKKLTKRERGYCEYREHGYIARDKPKELFWYDTKPHKMTIGWCAGGGCSEKIEKEMFPFITWEDEEPYDIIDLLTLDYEKE